MLTPGELVEQKVEVNPNAPAPLLIVDAKLVAGGKVVGYPRAFHFDVV